MAFDPKPSTWLGAGYALDGTNHLIKLNTNDAASNKLLAQLTDALANATTGDIRSVVFAICEACFQAWIAQGVNLPTRMTIAKSSGNDPTNNSLQVNYSFKFTLTLPGGQYTVASE